MSPMQRLGLPGGGLGVPDNKTRRSFTRASPRLFAFSYQRPTLPQPLTPARPAGSPTFTGTAPGAYLRASRAWAPGSTCCRTGRYPRAPWPVRRTAGAGRAALARAGSSRTHCRRQGRRRRRRRALPERITSRAAPCRLAQPPLSGTRSLPAPPTGSRHASNAPRHWWRAACPEPIPANPGPRWGSGAAGPCCQAMLGFFSARQTGLDDPLRLRRVECTRR